MAGSFLSTHRLLADSSFAGPVIQLMPFYRVGGIESVHDQRAKHGWISASGSIGDGPLVP